MLLIVLKEYFQNSCVPRGRLKTAYTFYLYYFSTTNFFHWNWDDEETMSLAPLRKTLLEVKLPS